MTNKEFALGALRRFAMTEAAMIRTKASAGKLTDTEIIDAEDYVPSFDPAKDYTKAPVGAPVKDGGQVYGLIQPHNAAHYDGRPAELRALWSLKHTKNPLKAKPFVAAQGTSGMYMKDEICTDPEAENPAAVYRSRVDNNVYAPHDYPQNWEVVEQGV